MAWRSAYYLRDHDFLLLEQYDELGGHARGSSSRGIGYSYGSAYIGDDEHDDLHQLISELGLKPIKMFASKNSWRWENEWAPGISGAKDVYREFKRMSEASEPTLRAIEKAGQLLPLTNESIAKLDKTVFASCLTGYDPKFMSLIDAYCRSSYCLGLERISALAGYCAIADLLEPNNVFEGGNQAIAKAIVQKVNPAGKQERCVKGAFVWSVEIKDTGVSVVYSLDDGSMHRVNARFAVVCTPPMISARILNGISDQTKAALLSLKYGSYLVANLILKKKCFAGSYDNWVTSPFTFTDIVDAGKPYEVSGSYKPDMGSVLTIYQAYEPGSAGRSELFKGDRQAFAASVVGQIEKLVPDAVSNIEKVVLTRWGHGVPAPTVGFFKKVTNFTASVNGAYALAHSSSQGLAW